MRTRRAGSAIRSALRVQETSTVMSPATGNARPRTGNRRQRLNACIEPVPIASHRANVLVVDFACAAIYDDAN